MQRDFVVHTHTSGPVTTLTVTGELDLASTPMLERELEQANDSGADVILLDLRGLAFMDSTGLHLLLRAHQSAEQAGRRLAVTKGGEQVQRLLDLTGVVDLVTIVESPAELLDGDRAADST